MICKCTCQKDLALYATMQIYHTLYQKQDPERSFFMAETLNRHICLIYHLLATGLLVYKKVSLNM